MADFKDLVVWQRAHRLAASMYEMTRAFPANEQFGLAAQMRRAGISIAVNIAESAGRYTAGDQARFLRIANGSSRELEALLLIARDVNLITVGAHDEAAARLLEIQKMLSGLKRHLQSKKAS